MFEQYNESAKNEATTDHFALRHQLKSGANWFYWIAGISLVNSVISLFDGNWNFAVGLGITQIFDGIIRFGIEEGSGNWIKAVFFSLDLVVAGMFVLLGVFANRRQSWAFVAGMILYALDGAIMIFAGDILGIIIHALALYFLFRGFQAARQLNQIEN
jgi:hypothetical protein